MHDSDVDPSVMQDIVSESAAAHVHMGMCLPGRVLQVGADGKKSSSQLGFPLMLRDRRCRSIDA